MLTELIIPKQFANNIWFNMEVVQAYIGILSAILYFGRDIILSGFVKIVELLSSLIFDFWEAITISLVRTIELPINIIEHILLQQFPIKTQRFKMISILKKETSDTNLYNLIDDNLDKITKIKELRVLEKSIIQYCENRRYIVS